MLVRDFLEASAARCPDKTALVCDGRRFSYSELDTESNRLAQALLAHGIGSGDRVAIHLPNSKDAVVGIFGALKAGATFVPVNSTTKSAKLRFILDNCRAAALICQGTTPPPKSQWLKLIVSADKASPASSNSVAFRTTAEIQNDFSAERPPRLNAESDLACLIYTSGSTGRPKGVMSEHRNVVFASGSIIQYLGNTESDIVLNTLPLSFDYGLYQLLMTFRFGGTLVLENSCAFPTAILHRIEEERVTGFPGVPSIFCLILRLDLAMFDTSSLRYLTNTAAALPPSHIVELRRAFPNATLFSMYGLTETKRALYLPPEELDRRPGSVGVAIPGTTAWIQDKAGNRLGPGNIGELVVCGPHVMRGYWEDPEATARRFGPEAAPAQRTCRTGDLFRQDKEGFFYFVGRTDDIIKTRGEKVAPKEIENVLYLLPQVAEAAVIGVPDPVFGQTIKAFIALCDWEISEMKVKAHCRAHLEEFMVPAEVEFLERLPKNASGKIDKLALSRSAATTTQAGRRSANQFSPVRT